MTETCYHCSDVATSREHIPPQGLFPAPKDLPPGIDLRKNLFTVPSCAKHNKATELDDEYVMYALCMCLPSNAVGQGLFRTKIMRAIGRNQSVVNRILDIKEHVLVHDTVTDTWSRTVAFQPDEKRLQTVFEKVARGVYYLEAGEGWNGTVVVVPEFSLSFDAPVLNAELNALSATVSEVLATAPRRGENPDVFSYQLTGDGTRFVIRLSFYGDASVLCVLSRGAG